nr:MAG TPA: hypothetical protein [Caudoviricetes sp.]
MLCLMVSVFRRRPLVAGGGRILRTLRWLPGQGLLRRVR